MSHNTQIKLFSIPTFTQGKKEQRPTSPLAVRALTTQKNYEEKTE